MIVLIRMLKIWMQIQYLKMLISVNYLISTKAEVAHWISLKFQVIFALVKTRFRLQIQIMIEWSDRDQVLQREKSSPAATEKETHWISLILHLESHSTVTCFRLQIWEIIEWSAGDQVRPREKSSLEATEKETHWISLVFLEESLSTATCFRL